jgi:hypothetical protein
MTNEIASTWIREALRECEQLGKLSTQPYFRLPAFREALAKAITALEHQPEPQTEVYPDAASVVGGKSPITIYEAFLKDSPSGLECNVCHWRTLDTTRTLCDSCGSFELAPVSDIGRKAGA